MYYSNMCEYGVHPTEVGITGFLSCIGVVYVTNNQLYAIHIPSRQSLYPSAQSKFAMFIAQTELPNIAGDLLVFSNGTERPGIVNELRPLAQALYASTKTLYLLNGAALGPVVGRCTAAAVQVQRLVAGSRVVSVKWAVHNTVGFTPGGTHPSGNFKNPNILGGGVVPGGGANWEDITSQNSQISHPW